MRNLKLHHARLGRILKDARLKKGLNQQAAAAVIGFHDRRHLHLAENGSIGITAPKLARAIKLYSLKIHEVIEASVADYRDALKEFLEK